MSNPAQAIPHTPPSAPSLPPPPSLSLAPPPRGVYEPLPASLSSECRDLVRRMLLVDPSSRAAMDDILRHPWVSRAAASPGLGAGGRLGSSSGLQGLLPSAASLPEPADDGACARLRKAVRERAMGGRASQSG